MFPIRKDENICRPYSNKKGKIIGIKSPIGNNVKYTELAQHFQSIIQTCENLRDDLNIFFMMHCEEIVSDGTIIGYQVATIGKLLLSQYNPVECVPMLLFSAVQYNEQGVASYGFYTHRCKQGSVEIPAKTPSEMFAADFIPNDLGYVTKAMNEYYGVA